MRYSEQIKSHNLALVPPEKQNSQKFWACFSGDNRPSGLIPLFGDDRGNGFRNGVNRFAIYDLCSRFCLL